VPPRDSRPTGSLLAPSTLRPLELDLRRVFWVITGCWALALAVLGVLALVDSVPGRTVGICATGFGLGFLALACERRHSRAHRPQSPASSSST
jgi:hypothetical protein